MGQRRTRAAVEAGRESIPVMIIDSPEEAERIVTQVVENIQRTELTKRTKPTPTPVSVPLRVDKAQTPWGRTNRSLCHLGRAQGSGRIERIRDTFPAKKNQGRSCYSS